MIIAQWINPEETTMEFVDDGTTTLVVVNTDGEVTADSPDVVEAAKQWLEEGNKPLPYFGGTENGL